MARPSHLEGRVRAVLAAERDRRAVTRRTAAVCAGIVLLATLPLAVVSPSERPAAQEYGWTMPPARTSGIHGRLTVEPAPARVATAESPAPDPAPAPASTPVPERRKAEWKPQTPVRPVERPALADRSERRRRSRSAVNVASPSLVASVDEEGNVHARVRLPDGARVRVEGHGVRSAGNEVQVDFNVLQAISALSKSAAPHEKCPPPSRSRATGRRTKVAMDVRDEVSRDKHDLALHILADLNDDETAVHAEKQIAREVSGG